jgi:hypothetical protein
VYVDVWPPMLGKDGTLKPELFVEDAAHDAGRTRSRTAIRTALEVKDERRMQVRSAEIISAAGIACAAPPNG